MIAMALVVGWFAVAGLVWMTREAYRPRPRTR
jgi:hypothetical protein